MPAPNVVGPDEAGSPAGAGERPPGRRQSSDAVSLGRDGGIEGTGPDGESVEPGSPRYTVAAVARRLGVAPSTLRTWARRYGLGPTDHAAGAHRRYSAADVTRLDLMRRHVVDGVAPADAARIALAGPDQGDGALAPGPARTVSAWPEPVSSPPDPAGQVVAVTPDTATGGPGGRILALPGGTPAERGLARAAMALDAAGVGRVIREHLDSVGVIATWNELIAPVLVAAGVRWELTAEGVDVEHLLSEAVIAALRGVVTQAALKPERRSLLLASAEDEFHSLPLYAVAAGLAERGIGARMLGAALPGDALRSAVRRLGPAGLFVWSQVRSTAAPETLATLPQTRPPTLVAVGGPGWDGAELPDRITVVRDLEGAVCLLAAAAGHS